MHLLKANQRESHAPEEIFAERYDWLLKWALYFAQGDQAEAEDLVQDTFVRFVVSEPEMKDMERIEALLYTYLKFVHLSHVRRTQRYPYQELPLVDFDSIHLAIRETPSVDPIEVQDTLRSIVAYLIWRKEKAKSASILLLRFFHGYRKDEIMQIGLLSDRVVANGLMRSREETRLHLAGDDEHSHAIHQTAPPILFRKGIAIPHDQFLAELRQAILDTCQSPCLPKDELLSRYQRINSKPIECRLLAHIVSCERCLDLVCKLHGMPPLSGRSPEEMMGSNRRTKLGLRTKGTGEGTKGTGEGGARRVLGIAQQRLNELYDHQPKQLMVAVNGRIIASRDVSSATSKLEVEIGRETKIEFIEIVSEQGVCLLGMPVDSVPPEAPPEMRHSAMLMNGRAVEMVLRFTGVGPFVDISYSDPSLPLLPATAADELEDSETNYNLEIVQPLQKPQEDAGSRSAFGFLALHRLMQPFSFPLMNSLLTTALVLGVASFLCFFLWVKQQPINVTANALLVKAEAWDPAITKSDRQGVVRQKVRIKTPGKAFEHTLYRDAQGVRVPKTPTLSSGEAQWTAKLSAANVNWEDPLSAASYQDWHDSQRSREDEVTRTGSNLLTLKTTVSQGEVVQETITVRESDFHPVERTVKFRDSGTVEIAELEYNVLPWQPASEQWFEPLAAMPSSGSLHGAILPRLPHVLSEDEFDAAELGARLALNQIGADTSERIDVLRIPSGVQVKGIVATDVRKREIESRLHLLPHVIPAIFTFQDLQSGRVSNPSETSLKLASTVAELTPLEQYLLAKGMSREEVGRFADQLFDDSASVSHGSKAINVLLARFSTDRQLSEPARAALAQLLDSHKKQILTTLQAEEQLVKQTGITVTSPIVAGDSSSDFKEAAEKNIALCRELVGNGIAQPRPAQAIVQDLLASAAQLRARVLRISADPPAK